jgi:hypothetical protein
MMSAPSQNPRNQREQLKPFMGKKVQVGLASFHYLCGVLEAFEGEQVRFSVKGSPVLVPRDQIAKIFEAPSGQTEFFK